MKIMSFHRVNCLIIVFLSCSLASSSIHAQKPDFTSVPALVDFSEKLQLWDGFGVNYVETSQTFDYEKWSQDYGSFSVLSQGAREQIIDLIFGDNGLRPDLVKMFLDPLHQQEKDGPYDHETTTANMRHFVRRGHEISLQRGQDLSIVTTLYSPPGYMTLQRELRGRDLDPAFRDDLAAYLVSWAGFLREREGLPLRYISLHNEGESWLRWPLDGGLADIDATGHDYNMFWSPELVNDMLIRTRRALDDAGLGDVGLTPGESTNWFRFGAWGYASELAGNSGALDALSLITSHGFYVGRIEAGRWYGPHTNRANNIIREARPGLHSWTTSSAWCIKNDRMVVDNEIVRRYIVNSLFILEIYSNIYEAQVNGYIPWAFIQRASQWVRPDPNPGSAIRAYDDGTWEIRKGYYYYKQVTSAGRKGMHVVHTTSMDSRLNIIGFNGEGTPHPDAVVVVNSGTEDMQVRLSVKDSRHENFRAYRTSGSDVYEYTETAMYEAEGDNYSPLGTFALDGDILTYSAPANSVTTFLGL